MSKRKAFNFYYSYYEVAKELSEKDRALFLWAILQKQFDGIEPSLTGIPKLAYISQKFNIDSQVSGYESKTGTKLTPTEGGKQGATEGGSVQEKGKGEEEVKEKGKEQGEEPKIDFSIFWDLYGKKVDSKKCKAKWDKLSNDVREKILAHVPKYVLSTPDSQYRKNPQTYLNNECWNDEVQETKSQPDVKILTRKDFYDEPAYQRYCSKNNITPEP